MENKLTLKIDRITLYYNLRYTLFLTIMGGIVITVIGSSVSAKIFAIVIWIAIFHVPTIIVIAGYLSSNYRQTIELTRDYFVFKSSDEEIKYLYSDIKQMIIYRQDEKTIDRMKYDSLLDFYFVKLKLNDSKEILITSLMIKNYSTFIEFFNLVEKTHIQNGVMHIWRD